MFFKFFFKKLFEVYIFVVLPLLLLKIDSLILTEDSVVCGEVCKSRF